MAAASPKPCNFGTKCRKFNCAFMHPPGRTQKCRYAGGCRNDECHRLHPECKDANCSQNGCSLFHKQKKQAAGAKARSPGKKTPRPQPMSQNAALVPGKAVVSMASKRPLCMIASVDISSSMGGQRIQLALEALEQVFNTLDKDLDHFGCFSFASAIERLHHPMPVGRVKFHKNKAVLEQCSGATALYEAIERGVEEFKSVQVKKKGFNMFHLVITDGEDNCSWGQWGAPRGIRNIKVQGLRKLLEDPGVEDYRLAIIGILPAAELAQEMKDFVSGIRGAYYKPVQDLHQLVNTIKQISATVIALDLNKREDLAKFVEQMVIE